MKKLLTLTLCILCLLSTALAGCSSDTADTADTTASEVNENPTETTSAEAEKTNSDIIREKHSGKDLGGAEIVIASITPGEWPYTTREGENELWFAEQSGDILYDAIYKRNMLTEEMLNAVIKPAWLGTFNDVVAGITNSVTAGDDEYDAVIVRLDSTMNMAAQGLLYDTLPFDIIDTDDTWWNQRLVQNFKINGKLFTLTGDANIRDDYAPNLIMFNKRIAENYHLDDLYQKVHDGTWTIDYFMSSALDATADLNGDGVLEIEVDQFGMAESSHAILHFVYAVGETMSHVNDDGVLEVTYNEKLVNCVDKLYNFFVSSGKIPIGAINGSIFRDGRKLFYVTGSGGLNGLRDMEDDFGALPVPKYDEATERYTAYISNGGTSTFSIPITNADAENTLIFIDTLQAFGTETVVTAFYDYLLSEKLLRDNESLEMMNTYILGSGQYDLAGDLAWASTLRDRVYSQLLKENSNTFVSLFEANINAVNASKDAFFEAFE